MIYRVYYNDYTDFHKVEFEHTSKTEEDFIKDCNSLIKELMQLEIEHIDKDGNIFIEKPLPTEFECVEYISENLRRFGYTDYIEINVIKYDISCDMFGCAMGNDNDINRIKELFPEDVSNAIIKRGKEIEDKE